jgi:hypothetical protein
MKSAFGVEHEGISKALATPMPKMARLTKPKTTGMARPAGPQANPLLRQVNRLSQGSPMGNRPMGGLQQRGANVRAGAPKPGQALRNRLGGNR